MIVVGDTSGLVAAFSIGNPEHRAARAALREASVTVVSPLVFAEVEHIVTRNIDRRTAYAVNGWLLRQEDSMRILVPELAADALRRARVVQHRYAGLNLDIADAVNVVLAERYETDSVPTLDRRDFRAIRPLSNHKAFRLLPDDL
ncbi:MULTISPECIES: PIN domain-containing protein [Protofrankia]|uniref:Ribonuclease VapC n=1 Tax=Candidatus Protofrankia datiscae TaxID=2716812 RepID=F8B4J9_9ACTN|nr:MULTISPECIES: PIN domain-containing protein [Protofrankia]AEH07941.1 PilT protein domain protein [Candidatus Protofrankia datiscae]